MGRGGAAAWRWALVYALDRFVPLPLRIQVPRCIHGPQAVLEVLPYNVTAMLQKHSAGRQRLHLQRLLHVACLAASAPGMKQALVRRHRRVQPALHDEQRRLLLQRLGVIGLE
jgi:hypothetical protein